MPLKMLKLGLDDSKKNLKIKLIKGYDTRVIKKIIQLNPTNQSF